MPYKAPTFHSDFFFTNCKRTNVDSFYLIHLTLFFMLSSNAKIGILPLFSVLRFVKQMFFFRVSQFFVSSLFLVHISLIKLYCVSDAYEELIGFEEEDNDIKFTGNYAIRGWLQQPPPLSCISCCIGG